MIFYNSEDFVKFIEANSAGLIGVTSGCFDLLHPLHVEYLNKCRRECGDLYVFIDSNRLVELNKNKTPLINEQDRAYMVSNLKSVSGVMIFNRLEEMSNTIKMLANSELLFIRIFKNSSTIYGSKIIEYGNNTEHFEISDIRRFSSTTEITEYLKNN